MAKFIIRLKGGKGSGNFGHGGRKGKVGGSSSMGEGSTSDISYNEETERSRINYEGPHGKETIGGWLDRHEVERTKEGKYVFYHATPKVGGVTTSLRKGSLLETDIKKAVFFAKRDRGLRNKDIKVIKLELRPSQIDGGVWASLTEDVDLSDGGG